MRCSSFCYALCYTVICGIDATLHRSTKVTTPSIPSIRTHQHTRTTNAGSLTVEQAGLFQCPCAFHCHRNIRLISYGAVGRQRPSHPPMFHLRTGGCQSQRTTPIALKITNRLPTTNHRMGTVRLLPHGAAHYHGEFRCSKSDVAVPSLRCTIPLTHRCAMSSPPPRHTTPPHVTPRHVTTYHATSTLVHHPRRQRTLSTWC